MEIGETTKLPSFSDEGFGVGKIELHGNVVEIHVGGNWREGREKGFFGVQKDWNGNEEEG